MNAVEHYAQTTLYLARLRLALVFPQRTSLGMDESMSTAGIVPNVLSSVRNARTVYIAYT